MKILVSFLATVFGIVLLMTSCFTNKPISQNKPYNNETYKVEYLFEHDGCKIYRFYDRGYYVYFTNCNSDVTTIQDDSTATVIQNIVRTK